ncbi:MAG TPA: hypothetical protein PK358_11025 [Spirochaetota bacterium]|nr:hypothetical protein [Spirochaetota bacterium]HPJ35360.1 hypothetical protein [Spirochaetota bacterium]
MNKFRIPVLSVLALVILFSSCKRHEPFVDPAYVFLKWSAAVKNLNYKDYSECEAFPKDQDVFRELYREYYYADLITRDMGSFNENDVKGDFEGRTFNYRMLYFECNRVSRETGEKVEIMKGEVEFIKYLKGADEKRGWLMYNRTFIRTGISE